jgi:hypothetical protein
MKVYKAIIWDTDQNRPGKRVSILANDLSTAKEKLEAEYGKGHIFDLHNEEEASRIR